MWLSVKVVSEVRLEEVKGSRAYAAIWGENSPGRGCFTYTVVRQQHT